MAWAPDPSELAVVSQLLRQRRRWQTSYLVPSLSKLCARHVLEGISRLHPSQRDSEVVIRHLRAHVEHRGALPEVVYAFLADVYLNTLTGFDDDTLEGYAFCMPGFHRYVLHIAFEKHDAAEDIRLGAAEWVVTEFAKFKAMENSPAMVLFADAEGNEVIFRVLQHDPSWQVQRLCGELMKHACDEFVAPAERRQEAEEMFASWQHEPDTSPVMHGAFCAAAKLAFSKGALALIHVALRHVNDSSVAPNHVTDAAARLVSQLIREHHPWMGPDLLAALPYPEMLMEKIRAWPEATLSIGWLDLIENLSRVVEGQSDEAPCFGGAVIRAIAAAGDDYYGSPCVLGIGAAMDMLEQDYKFFNWGRRADSTDLPGETQLFNALLKALQYTPMEVVSLCIGQRVSDPAPARNVPKLLSIAIHGARRDRAKPLIARIAENNARVLFQECIAVSFDAPTIEVEARLTAALAIGTDHQHATLSFVDELMDVITRALSVQQPIVRVAGMQLLRLHLFRRGEYLSTEKGQAILDAIPVNLLLNCETTRTATADLIEFLFTKIKGIRKDVVARFVSLVIETVARGLREQRWESHELGGVLDDALHVMLDCALDNYELWQGDSDPISEETSCALREVLAYAAACVRDRSLCRLNAKRASMLLLELCIVNRVCLEGLPLLALCKEALSLGKNSVDFMTEHFGPMRGHKTTTPTEVRHNRIISECYVLPTAILERELAGDSDPVLSATDVMPLLSHLMWVTPSKESFDNELTGYDTSLCVAAFVGALIRLLHRSRVMLSTVEARWLAETLPTLNGDAHWKRISPSTLDSFFAILPTSMASNVLLPLITDAQRSRTSVGRNAGPCYFMALVSRRWSVSENTLFIVDNVSIRHEYTMWLGVDDDIGEATQTACINEMASAIFDEYLRSPLSFHRSAASAYNVFHMMDTILANLPLVYISQEVYFLARKVSERMAGDVERITSGAHVFAEDAHTDNARTSATWAPAKERQARVAKKFAAGYSSATTNVEA